jgi:multiple sugar transport system permease protein
MTARVASDDREARRAKISAMSVLGTLPIFFAVAAFQRYLVRGITLGAVKG